MSRLENESICPKCGKVLDAATSIEEGAIPSPGDITICMYCGELLRFDENLISHKLSDEEFESLDEEFQAQLLDVQEQIRVFSLLRKDLESDLED